MSTPSERREVPVALGFAMGLLGEVGAFRPELWTGPCQDRQHCPLFAGEQWTKGKCMLDGCPRNMVYDLIIERGERASE